MTNQFSKLDDVLFICNQTHTSRKSPSFVPKLKEIRKNSKIVSIKPHNLGPVETILQAEKYINRIEPVIISYCDCVSIFNEKHFYSYLKSNKHSQIKFSTTYEM